MLDAAKSSIQEHTLWNHAICLQAPVLCICRRCSTSQLLELKNGTNTVILESCHDMCERLEQCPAHSNLNLRITVCWAQINFYFLRKKKVFLLDLYKKTPPMTNCFISKHVTEYEKGDVTLRPSNRLESRSTRKHQQ